MRTLALKTSSWDILASALSRDCGSGVAMEGLDRAPQNFVPSEGGGLFLGMLLGSAIVVERAQDTWDFRKRCDSDCMCSTHCGGPEKASKRQVRHQSQKSIEAHIVRVGFTSLFYHVQWQHDFSTCRLQWLGGRGKDLFVCRSKALALPP